MEEKIGGYFPQELIDHATQIMGFGGAYDTGKMKKIDKFVFEKVAKSGGVQDNVKYEAIEEFAGAMTV